MIRCGGGCDAGQAVAELALAVPAFLIAIIVVVNALSFVALAGQFDRAVGDWARANVANPRDPLPYPLWQNVYLVGQVRNPPALASVAVKADLGSAFDSRKVTFTMTYYPFGSPLMTAMGLRKIASFKRVKTVTFPHYRAKVVP